MTKRVEKKDDGRYIIYYEFKEENSSAKEEKKTGNCNQGRGEQ
jgi:hypothetical protein